MKILDLDENLGRCTVSFYARDWGEFDRTVGWLLRNGVPLVYAPDWREQRPVRVGKNGMAYWTRSDGRRETFNAGLTGTMMIVEAKEGFASYQVMSPDVRR